MLLQTKHFGEIEVDKDKILTFKEGLPGFENIKKYSILYNQDTESPFRWLQSVDEPKLAFALVDPFQIKKDYCIDISDEVLASLGIIKAEEVLVYSVVVVPEDISKMSMNLRAPVIINTGNNRGAQIVLDTDKYTVRHYILEELGLEEELNRQEVDGDACSNKEEATINYNK